MLLAWGLLDLESPQLSFIADVLPQMLAVLMNGQRQAADIGADYMDASADALGVSQGPLVNRSAFVGVASDGRDLTGLLTDPFVGFLTALARGAQHPLAKSVTAGAYDRIAVTQLHDAARESGQVGLVVNTEIRGYTRFVEPGACGRCVVLAGRFYRWNDGFKRHPKCRCANVPSTRSNPHAQSARELFDAMSVEQQNASFTVDGAQAIRDGADPSRVINARQGMSTVQSPTGRNVAARQDVLGQQVFTTTALAKGRNAPARLMPASIYELATDRQDAIRLLRLHNYIT